MGSDMFICSFMSLTTILTNCNLNIKFGNPLMIISVDNSVWGVILWVRIEGFFYFYFFLHCQSVQRCCFQNCQAFSWTEPRIFSGMIGAACHSFGGLCTDRYNSHSITLSCLILLSQWQLLFFPPGVICKYKKLCGFTQRTHSAT